jgi:hypothetical protein
MIFKDQNATVPMEGNRNTPSKLTHSSNKSEMSAERILALDMFRTNYHTGFPKVNLSQCEENKFENLSDQPFFRL